MSALHVLVQIILIYPVHIIIALTLIGLVIALILPFI